MDGYFAQVSSDHEAIIGRVMRAATEECAPDSCPVAPVLDRCVRDAVAELWDRPVKTFVPLLALRRVRSCIRVGSCDSEEF